MKNSTHRFQLLLAFSVLFLIPFHVHADTDTGEICCACAPKDAPNNVSCVKGDGANCTEMVAKSPNADLKKAKCEDEDLKEKCKPKKEGGSCVIGPMTEATFSINVSADPGSIPLKKLVIPQLNVPIPGLEFATTQEEKTGILKSPFLAQYISAIYRYVTGISVVAAAIVIVFGGFLYIAGSTIDQEKAGVTYIQNAIIGLVLVLGAYAILNTLNPQTLNLVPLEINVIKPSVHIVPVSTFNKIKSLAAKSGYSGADIKHVLPDISTWEKNLTLEPEKLDQILKKIADANGLDPCIIKGIVVGESGLKQNAMGHDEDKPSDSRTKFLKRQKKYSGKTFDSASDPNIRNDDDPTPNPPDFGLDWEFSHGVGVGQCTIFPSALGCKGSNGEHGRLVSGTCFTVPILFTWEGQLDCMSKILKEITKTTKDPCKVFQDYNGDHKDKTCTGHYLKGKMNAYNACKGSGK